MITFLLSDLRAAWATVCATVGAGIGILPDDVGEVASAAGVVLSLVLICTHFRNGRLEHKRLLLETEIREIELANLKRQLLEKPHPEREPGKRAD